MDHLQMIFPARNLHLSWIFQFAMLIYQRVTCPRHTVPAGPSAGLQSFQHRPVTAEHQAPVQGQVATGQPCDHGYGWIY